ncbi:hypothetical protein A3Q56_06903 [Intoshia linei]|uniref:GMP reductase n=1 Tax=Intoshia linei TaxID=1819745 RepID=A0A177ATR0_9BILA|nr:hypothetical protein A3Q56_06903 [Intoshia linei]
MARVLPDTKLDFIHVLFQPKRSTVKSRNDVNLICNYTFKHSKNEYSGIPVMAANMDTIGTIDIAEALTKKQMFTVMHKFHKSESIVEMFKKNDDYQNTVALSSGMSKVDIDQICKLIDHENVPIKYVCLDVANGYSEDFVDFVRYTREKLPKTTIMAGNVVTDEMVQELILAGADIVKIGIGPGSVCTTRIKTGVGYPQFSAILECADAAHDVNGFIISDGGCTCSGDVAKAIGAGADFVMIGGLLAGHDECSGEVETDKITGKKFKKFYGMASKTSMQLHSNKVCNYRASEGRTVIIPYKGPVVHTINDILGGLRSTCSYVGATSLKELYHRATFIKVHRQYNSSMEMFTVKD